MIVVRIRLGDGDSRSLSLHHALTVVTGLDPAARSNLAAELPRAFRGQPSSVGIEVEVDGKREWLTPDLARRLGLGSSSAALVVEPSALPGASPAPVPQPESPTEAGDGAAPVPAADAAGTAADAAVAGAEAALASAEAALAEAQRVAVEADAAVGAAGEDDVPRSADAVAGGPVAQARQRVEQLRRELEAAREALAAAERASGEEQRAELQQARTVEVVETLVREQGELEQARAELVARLAETSGSADPAAVEQALAELRRVRALKPVPSAAAEQLADRWLTATKKLADLPAPPEPPQWLVAPAKAALQDAREALARAEAGAHRGGADAGLVEALDRAHRQVLEAEQKMMRKGSRMHRRKLDQAYENERAALQALGVSSYGEYLQRLLPEAGGSTGDSDPTAAARAALADAEAVWEELHGGQASREWTAAKEEASAVRREAHELLGRDVPDGELEAALRSHQEGVADARAAEEALEDALVSVAGEGLSEPDLEAAAQRWLVEAPRRNEARAEVERQLAALDERLAAVSGELADHQADVFFGPEDVRPGPSGPGDDGTGTSAAQGRVQKAEQDVKDAEEELTRLEQQAADLEQRRRRRAALDEEAQAARAAVVTAGVAVGEAREDLEAARGAARAAASVAAAGPPVAEPAPERPAPELRGVTALEAQLYLLALVAAVQGAPLGPLPLFMDAGTVALLPEAVGRSVLAVLERAAGPVQVVLLGDDGPVGEWAKEKGKGAAVVAATGSP